MKMDRRAVTYVKYDEAKILQQRVNLNRKKYNSIEKGMYIQDRVERFEQLNLFENKLGIMVPQSFGEIPDEYKKIKYPSEFRPEIIISSEDLSVNLGFNFYPQESTEDELFGVADQLQKMLTRSSSEIEFFREHEIAETTNCDKFYYDFRSQALDEAIYNMHFLTIIDRRIMFGMFNCLYRHTDDWFDAAKQMIESVVDLTKHH